MELERREESHEREIKRGESKIGKLFCRDLVRVAAQNYRRGAPTKEICW